MRATKQRLTIISGKVKDLPDDNDLFGFQGISKTLILAVIEDCYSTVTALDDYDSAFEVILLERKSSDYFERCSKLLKEDFKHNKEAFDEFLTTIAKLHFRIKETYIAVVEQPIRVESDLVAARNNLLNLQTKLQEIEPLTEEISTIKIDSVNFLEDLKNKHSAALEKEEIITKTFEEIELLKTDAEKAALQIPTWEENINVLKEDIVKKRVDYSELLTKIESLKSESERNSERNAELLSELEAQVNKNEEFQEEIQKTIEDANRHGMAGSFKKRKDELNKSLIIWGIGTVISIVALITLSVIILWDLKSDDMQWQRVLSRMPVFASCVWLGWFCAKQYGFTSRIMEDYSYKYAVSMAFEGYKKATKEVNEELQMKLLELTVFNISNSPLNIYETTNNDGTPYHEFLKKLPKISITKTSDQIKTETIVENS